MNNKASKQFEKLIEQTKNAGTSDIGKKGTVYVLITRHTEQLNEIISKIWQGDISFIPEKDVGTQKVLREAVNIKDAHCHHYLADLIKKHDEIARVKLPLHNEQGKRIYKYVYLNLYKITSKTLEVIRGFTENEASNDMDIVSQKRITELLNKEVEQASKKNKGN